MSDETIEIAGTMGFGLPRFAQQEDIVREQIMRLVGVDPHVAVSSSTVEGLSEHIPEAAFETGVFDESLRVEVSPAAVEALSERISEAFKIAIFDQRFKHVKLPSIDLVVFSSGTGQVLEEPGFVIEHFTESAEETATIPKPIIENWQLLATSGLTEQSYLSLLKLAKKTPGWRGAGSRSLDYRSLGSFLRFWKTVREKSAEPEFVLVPNGNLQAEWYRNDNHFVEIEFGLNDKCLFGVFDGEAVLEGRTSVKNIVELLATQNYGPLKWSDGN